MKSLYFQTVGIECKLYEVRACLKNYSHNLHAPPRGIFCPNSVVVARYGAFIVTYILQKTFFKHALLCYDILIGFSRNVFIFQ